MRVRTAAGAAALAAALCALASPAAHAQALADYPSQPIRIIVPYPPGGAADVLARLVGQKMAEGFRQQVIVDNRPGAGGGIGAVAGARAAPDGHTLTVTPVGLMAINPWVYAKLAYAPLADFQPVTLIAKSPFLLAVGQGLPATSLREFVELARTRPAKLTIGNAGAGTGQHLGAEHLAAVAGIRLVHVAYKGSAPATTDLLAGVIDAQFDFITVLPHLKSGRLRALGVSSAARLPSLPDVPTLAESGLPGFEVTAWNGLVAPAGTPMPIVERVQREVARILALPDVRERLIGQGYEPGGDTPEAFARFVRAEMERYRKIAADAGIKPE